MSIERISPEQAQATLASDEGWVYLDVRSSQEFTAGHVPGARNIALLERNPAGPGLVPNPNFVEQVSEAFDKNTPIITGCLRGGRSLRAAGLLQAAGFTRLVDMRGGMDGEMSGGGQIAYPGWARRGLPVTQE